jgi:SAM-dependent methyltransferase
MNETENSKHYFGLAAEWYDRLLETEKKDISLYTDKAAAAGSPVLELACGTGRLMIPMLEGGLKVDGIDASTEMLALCREKLAGKNLEASLYEQDIASFDLNKQYKFIFISGGSFQILHSLDDAYNCLQSVYQHLEPGGTFMLDTFIPFDDIISSSSNHWKLGRTASDGNEKLMVSSALDFDLIEQCMYGNYTYNLYRDNKLVQSETGSISLRWYGNYELVLMLEKTGFKNIRFETSNVMTTHSNEICITASK